MEVYGRSSIEHHVLDKHDEFVTLKNLVKTNDVISTSGIYCKWSCSKGERYKLLKYIYTCNLCIFFRSFPFFF